jgi:type II secretory pathway component GspD/PulD (secretin)
MAIDALQEKTKVNTLSTPKILAIHGRAAKVQVGGKQGYKVTTTNVGVATESIEFIDTGTVLEITPYIDDNNHILLKVEPSITSADVEEGIPVTQTTYVSTWLMAEDGETVFIGGLIRNTESKTREMIPCLGGTPGVGFLFGRTETELDKSELVVLITPTIVDSDTRQVSMEPAEKTKKMEEHFGDKPFPMLKQMKDFIKPVH